MIHGMISVLVAAVLAALLVTQGAAAQAILLEGARVVAGDGSPPIENAALLVEGNIISRIGRKGDIALPAGGTRIGLDGKTMMPAIISTCASRLSEGPDLPGGEFRARDHHG